MNMSVAHIGVTIPPNQALSGGIDLGQNKLVAIEIPTNYTGSTVLSFQSKIVRGVGVGSADDSDIDNVEEWRNLYDDQGNEVQVTVAANRIIAIDYYGGSFATLRYLRIRSGTSASPVNINPGVTLRLIVKE